MRIHLYPADNGACGNLRLRWPGEIAASVGYDVRVFDPGRQGESLPLIVGINPQGNPEARLVGDLDFDVAVFQRPLEWRVQFAIPLLQLHGVRCVVEIDDDLGSVHAQHDAFQYLNPTRNPENNHGHLARACAVADAVVVTTPALARRYGQQRAIVVENHVPRRYLDATAEHDPDRVVIGWTGKVGSHAGDLNVMRGAMFSVLEAEPSAVFRVLGDSRGVDHVLSLRRPPELVGGVPMEQYPGEVAKFDIGIAPLADNEFNRSKSWLKPLDYAACGVPFVCSASDEYMRFTSSKGCGFVARKPREWIRELRRLIQEPSLRADMGAAGREAAKQWVMEDHVDRYVEAWAGVVPVRHTPMTATATQERTP